jgi:hypothetical protein
MSAKVSTKTMLTLVAAVATFGAAALAPTSASAFSRTQSFATSQTVKGPTVHPSRWCAIGVVWPGCHSPNAIFVRPGNPGNAVFAH